MSDAVESPDLHPLPMIRILPYVESGDVALDAPAEGADDYLTPLIDRHVTYFNRGRDAIDAVLGQIGVRRADEVLVLNTTDQTYISSCVTCTIFNHCQPSRVLTADTKAVLLIHEYGIPYPETEAWTEACRDRGMPLIEDCAHTFDSLWRGKVAGTFGDYAVFSMSKIFPVRNGGILTSRVPLRSTIGDAVSDQVEGALRELGPYLPVLSRRRRATFQALRESVGTDRLWFDAPVGTTPYFCGVRSPKARDIRAGTKTVEWGSTRRDDVLLVPTNPMVPTEAIVDATMAALA